MKTSVDPKLVICLLKKRKSAFFVFISSILYDAIVSYGKIVPYAYRGVPVDKVCADLSGPNTSDLSFKKVKNWRFGIHFQPPI